MISPTFYTLPGDESFIPTVSHPGEDAGADIRAYAKGLETDISRSYHEFETWALKYGTRFYVDGEVFTSESESDLIDIAESCGGAVILAPGETLLVSSGFKIALPDMSGLGYPWNSFVPVYKIVPRSGLAHKHRIIVTNSPGIVDAGYRDWVKVSLTNNGDDYHMFTHGARIAQGLCELAIDQSQLKRVTDESQLPPSKRSENGFGSTKV